MSNEKFKVLTEAYITGANPSSGYAPNANLEDGEYTRFPDGSIAQVLGERHTNGGVDLVLPQYTQILSDTKDLKLTKEDVKRIKKELGVEATIKNTYSDVLDKYAKKIGYSKILEDQEALFKKAEKEVFAVKDEATRNLNRNFFTKKITELEQDKEAKQSEMSSAFDVLFYSQEEQKGTPVEEMVQVPPTPEEQIQEVETAVNTIEAGNQIFSEQEVYEYGGQINTINTLSKTHNIDARKLFEKLKTEGKLRMFNNGGMLTPQEVSNLMIMDSSTLLNQNPEDILRLQNYNFSQSRVPRDPKKYGYKMSDEELQNYVEQSIKSGNSYFVSNPSVKEIWTSSPNNNSEIYPVFNKPSIESANSIKNRYNVGNDVRTPLPEENFYRFQGTNLDPTVYGRPERGSVEIPQFYELEGLKLSNIEKAKILEEEKNINKVLTNTLSDSELKEIKTLNITPTEYFRRKNINPTTRLQFQTGGVTNTPPSKFSLTKRGNIYENEAVERQSPNTQAYGKISSAESALNELYRNFPRAFRATDISNIATIENGKVKLKSGVSLGKINAEINNLQKGIDTYMTNSANYVINNADKFDTEAIEYASKYLTDETFQSDPNSVRAFDGKLGQFTAGRFSLGVNLVTPDEAKKLRDIGIYSAKDLADADSEKIKFLTEGTLDRVKNFVSGMPEEADFSIDTYSPSTPNPQLKADYVPKGGEANEVADLVTGENVEAVRRYPRRFMTPDFGFIPPSGLTPESMQSIALARVDPVRVGIEDQLKSLADARNAMTIATADLPQAQRSAFLAETLGSSMRAESDAITKASQINAQNQSQADLYNANAYNQEQQYNNAMRADYERRVLRGLDVTEQNFRNGMAFLHNAFLEDWNRQMQLNTLDSMTPDISIDNYGVAGYYNPQRPYQLSEQQLLAEQVMRASQQQPVLPTKITKKKEG